MLQNVSCENDKSKFLLMVMFVTDLKNDRAEKVLLIKMVGLIISIYFVDDGRHRAVLRLPLTPCNCLINLYFKRNSVN